MLQKKSAALLAAAMLCLPVTSREAVPAAGTSEATLQYAIEWRLIRAGTARLTWNPLREDLRVAKLHLASTGLVSKLFPVDDRYVANFQGEGCPTDIWSLTNEGDRRRETKITFDPSARRASYLEKDLSKNTVLLSTQLTVPECAFDILGGLHRLREIHLEPGQATQFPVTNGKKLVSARIEAQEREEIKTPLGTFKTVRHEAFLFNNVLFQRKGRLFIWLTDDERRLPVQIRVQMQLHIGTVTLSLEKEERS